MTSEDTNESKQVQKQKQGVATSDPNAWGQPISTEQQAELQGMLDAWKAPDARLGERRSLFDAVDLTGAEVSWLTERSGRDPFDGVPNSTWRGPASALCSWREPSSATRS